MMGGWVMMRSEELLVQYFGEGIDGGDRDIPVCRRRKEKWYDGDIWERWLIRCGC